MAEDWVSFLKRQASGVGDYVSSTWNAEKQRRQQQSDEFQRQLNTPRKPVSWQDMGKSLYESGEQLQESLKDPYGTLKKALFHPDVIEPAKASGEKILQTLGGTSEAGARGLGATADVVKDPRKPLTDIAWEAAKGLKNTYNTGSEQKLLPSKELEKRTGYDLGPVVNFGLDAGVDFSNAVPGKAIATGLGMAGKAAMLGTDAAAIFPNWKAFKEAKGIDSLWHGLNNSGDRDRILRSGFRGRDSNDVMDRWTIHAGREGLASNFAYGGGKMELTAPRSGQILDLTTPMTGDEMAVLIGSAKDPKQKKHLVELWKNQQRAQNTVGQKFNIEAVDPTAPKMARDLKTPSVAEYDVGKMHHDIVSSPTGESHRPMMNDPELMGDMPFDAVYHWDDHSTRPMIGQAAFAGKPEIFDYHDPSGAVHPIKRHVENAGTANEKVQEWPLGRKQSRTTPVPLASDDPSTAGVHLKREPIPVAEREYSTQWKAESDLAKENLEATHTITQEGSGKYIIVPIGTAPTAPAFAPVHLPPVPAPTTNAYTPPSYNVAQQKWENLPSSKPTFLAPKDLANNNYAPMQPLSMAQFAEPLTDYTKNQIHKITDTEDWGHLIKQELSNAYNGLNVDQAAKVDQMVGFIKNGSIEPKTALLTMMQDFTDNGQNWAADKIEYILEELETMSGVSEFAKFADNGYAPQSPSGPGVIGMLHPEMSPQDWLHAIKQEVANIYQHVDPDHHYIIDNAFNKFDDGVLNFPETIKFLSKDLHDNGHFSAGDQVGHFVKYAEDYANANAANATATGYTANQAGSDLVNAQAQPPAFGSDYIDDFDDFIGDGNPLGDPNQVPVGPLGESVVIQDDHELQAHVNDTLDIASDYLNTSFAKVVFTDKLTELNIAKPPKNMAQFQANVDEAVQEVAKASSGNPDLIDSIAEMQTELDDLTDSKINSWLDENPLGPGAANEPPPAPATWDPTIGQPQGVTPPNANAHVPSPIAQVPYEEAATPVHPDKPNLEYLGPVGTAGFDVWLDPSGLLVDKGGMLVDHMGKPYMSPNQLPNGLWGNSVIEAIKKEVAGMPLIPAGFDPQYDVVEVFDSATGNVIQTFKNPQDAYNFVGTQSYFGNKNLDYMKVSPGEAFGPAVPSPTVPAPSTPQASGWGDLTTNKQSQSPLSAFQKDVDLDEGGILDYITENGLEKDTGEGSKLAGMHEKSVFELDGHKFIYKPSHNAPGPFVPMAEEAASNVARILDKNTPQVRYVEMPDGSYGTIQQAVNNKLDYPTIRSTGEKLTDLADSEVRTILRNHAVDWLVANHDAHRGQFMRTPQGLIEIDRGQAFKHFGQDKLEIGYNPNQKFGEEPVIYHGIKQQFAKAGKNVPVEEAMNAAKELQAAFQQNPDLVDQVLAPYLSDRFQGNDAGRVKFQKQFLERLSTLDTDMWNFWMK